MSGTKGLVLALLVAVGPALATTPAAHATTITEFTNGLPVTADFGGITPGPDGNLWFTDKQAIGQITPSGTITEFADGLNPGADLFHDIVEGADGNLWFGDTGTTHAIGRITPSGAIREFDLSSNTEDPDAMVLGADGNLWFLDLGPDKGIGRITPSGTITVFPITAHNSQPNDIALGADGNIWFTDQGDTPAIGRVTPDGTITEFTGPLGMGSKPNELTAGADGNIWFTDEGSPGQVGRVKPDGTIDVFDDHLPMDSNPDGITAGPDGNVWFVDQAFGDKAIGRITPNGTITEFKNNLATDSMIDDITTGADGNIWIEQATPPAIGRITPAGAINEVTAGRGPDAGADGDALTVGPDGNLWFTDRGTPRAIGRVALDLPPTATTGGVSAITSSSAVVSGTVTPLGALATVAFQYGATTALGSTMAAGSLTAGLMASTVTATLTGLPPSSFISYQLTATDMVGTTPGGVRTFTTAAAPSGPITPPTTPVVPPPVATRTTFDNQQITFTTPSPLVCFVGQPSALTVQLSSTAIARSHATRLHFVSAAFFVDKGVKHTRKKTEHPEHGKKRTVTVTVYTANATVAHVPATVRVPFKALASGQHTLKAVLSYTKTVTKHHHKTKVTVTRTVTTKFKIC